MDIKDYLEYCGARCLLAIFRAFPKPASIALATTLALAYSFFDRRHKEIARVNLRIAFPDWPDSRRELVLLASYRNLARLAVELSRFSTLNSQNIDSLVRYDEKLGLNNYLQARSKGRGVLFLTGHFSSWELLPFAHALHGYPLSFVVRPLDNTAMETLLDKLRCSCGNQTLPKRNSTRSILEILARGESVGILIDQNVLPTEGGFVPFFGKLAATTTGLARLAMKTKAPVIPGRLQWCPPEKRYRMIFWPEIALVNTGNREQDVLTNTRLFNQAIEEMIRLEPESWLWGHKRWNSRPPEDPENPYAHIK